MSFLADTGRPPATPGRVLVVDADPDTPRYVDAALRQQATPMRLLTATDPVRAADLVARGAWDIVVTELDPPGMSGLALIEQVQVLRPGLPMIGLADPPTSPRAVRARQMGVAGVLGKPVDVDGLSQLLWRVLAELTRSRLRVLAIGAHPGDVEVGVGGTLADQVLRGHTVTALTLSTGPDGGPGAGARGGTHEWVAQASEASSLLGARMLIADLPDEAMSDGARTAEVIAQAFATTDPTAVYLPSRHDTDDGHRTAHSAAVGLSDGVDQVYGYQTPTSTGRFQPSRFVGVDAVIERKLDAVNAYRSPVRCRTGGRTEELIRTAAARWGRFSWQSHAEALEVIREPARVPQAGSSSPLRTDGQRIGGTG